MKNTFFGKSFISIEQITSTADIDYIFSVADKMKKTIESGKVYEPLKGKTVAVLFYQPSTRTFTSFVAAAKRLGAYVIDINEMTSFSSAVKGESLEDTIKSIYQTTGANAIILRHPDNTSSEIAASVQNIPVINGGSGTAEHPTQALLDLYTIYNKFKRLDDLHIMMVGDLKYGRTIKSLAKLIARISKNSKITFVSPKELRAPKDFIKDLKDRVEVSQRSSFGTEIEEADVVYMTRVQKEWFEKEGKLDQYEALKLKFIMNKHVADKMKKDAIILHPLPRVGEIMLEVDNDPRAWYFEQMRSGLYIRMALIESILMGS
jgi:aspartate carbamoyltransferase